MGTCAANILAIAIPCHRVVKSDGGSSGYRWGVDANVNVAKKVHYECYGPKIEKHVAGIATRVDGFDWER